MSCLLSIFSFLPFTCRFLYLLSWLLCYPLNFVIFLNVTSAHLSAEMTLFGLMVTRSRSHSPCSSSKERRGQYSVEVRNLGSRVRWPDLSTALLFPVPVNLLTSYTLISSSVKWRWLRGAMRVKWNNACKLDSSTVNINVHCHYYFIIMIYHHYYHRIFLKNPWFTLQCVILNIFSLSLCLICLFSAQLFLLHLPNAAIFLSFALGAFFLCLSHLPI